MVFILFIAGLLGLAVFFLFITGTFIGDAIKEANLTEEKKAAKRKKEDDYEREFWRECFYDRPEEFQRRDVMNAGENPQHLKELGLWDEFVAVIEANELYAKLATEEAALELEERRLNLERRKQRLQAQKRG